MTEISDLPKPMRDRLRAMLMDVEPEPEMVRSSVDGPYARIIKAVQDEAHELMVKKAVDEVKKKAVEEIAFNEKRAQAERLEAAEYKKVRKIKGQYKYSKWDPEPPKPVEAVPKPEGWGDFA